MVNPCNSPSAASVAVSLPWHRQLSRYHWLVLVVCTLAWLFDCLNQQIFNLARTPAMADLLVTTPDDPRVTTCGGLATSMLLIGWATGGILFGIMADRTGRVKTLVVMILCYSVSTGLCGLAQAPWDFILYCFITGMGAGGIFPIGCTLVAESLPDRTRPHALGMLQAFSAVGNVGAAFISLLMIELWSRNVIASQWRWMFSVGIVPALLAIVVIRRLREPEAWKNAVADGKSGKRKKAGSLVELFGDPRWRRRAIVGMLLAASGVVGLWGIGVFSNDLTQSFIGKDYDDKARSRGEAKADLRFVASVIASPERLETVKSRVLPKDLLGADGTDVDAKSMYAAALGLQAQGQKVSPESVLGRLDQTDADGKFQTTEERARRRAEIVQPTDAGSSLDEHIARIVTRQKDRGILARRWAAVTLAMFNVGAFFGIYAFARITHVLGRRLTFAIFFVAAGLSTALAFLYMSKPADLFWMVPLMGACQLSVFGGYAIYFPELFPTRLRSTGTSFCYNVGRYVAAAGPLTIAFLKGYVFVNPDNPVLAFRHAGVAMCSCFLVGLVALLFAPETKDQPLPE